MSSVVPLIISVDYATDDQLAELISYRIAISAIASLATLDDRALFRARNVSMNDDARFF